LALALALGGGMFLFVPCPAGEQNDWWLVGRSVDRVVARLGTARHVSHRTRPDPHPACFSCRRTPRGIHDAFFAKESFAVRRIMCGGWNPHVRPVCPPQQAPPVPGSGGGGGGGERGWGSLSSLSSTCCCCSSSSSSSSCCCCGCGCCWCFVDCARTRQRAAVSSPRPKCVPHGACRALPILHSPSTSIRPSRVPLRAGATISDNMLHQLHHRRQNNNNSNAPTAPIRLVRWLGCSIAVPRFASLEEERWGRMSRTDGLAEPHWRCDSPKSNGTHVNGSSRLPCHRQSTGTKRTRPTPRQLDNEHTPGPLFDPLDDQKILIWPSRSTPPDGLEPRSLSFSPHSPEGVAGTLLRLRAKNGANVCRSIRTTTRLYRPLNTVQHGTSQ
jgi:hypothetical protein